MKNDPPLLYLMIAAGISLFIGLLLMIFGEDPLSNEAIDKKEREEREEERED